MFVQDQMKLIQQQLATMMERQRADTSTGTSQVHPHCDEAHDDQPLPCVLHMFYMSFFILF